MVKVKAVKKSVSFNPAVLKDVEDYRIKLIGKLWRPISFSEVVNDLLRAALDEEAMK